MGEVFKLKDYQNRTASRAERSVSGSMVPIEFAVGFAERNLCLAKLAEYAVSAIEVRKIKNEPGALVYLMSVKDALWLSKKILEREDLSEKEVADRIDLIQMLENINLPMMESLWDSFTGKSPS
ncbi:MAG: hypothetical protein ACJAY7_000475 [Pseudohongiellaceae bacterium]|jgi:hypothetical protein